MALHEVLIFLSRVDVYMFIAFVCFIAGYLLYSKDYRAFFTYVGLLVFAFLAIFELKSFFNVARPVDALTDAFMSSFPSGHSVIIVVLALSSLYLFHPHIKTPLLRGLHIIAALSMIPLVGYYRLALGVHRPEEIVAGYMFGVLIVFAVLAVSSITLKQPLLKRSYIRKH